MSSTASQSDISQATSKSNSVQTEPPSTLEKIYAPIKEELALVEQLLQTELRSKTPWVDQLLEHSWLLGGKRMRPAFTLLSAGCLGEIEQPVLQMAAALEMVHTATLVHDDILDEAETRRHKPTANSKWGNKVSVLLGDYLFTHSFHVASLSDSAEAVRLLAVSSNRVCEGEMRQNAWRGNFDLSEANYIQMVSDKTAELTACACEIGALLRGGSFELRDGFRQFGLDLGIAFQIIDDIFDLAGDEAVVGKTLGTDLINQKPTLPVIHALANLSGDSRQQMLDLLYSSEPQVESVLSYLKQTDSLQYARQLASDHAIQAKEFADQLEPNSYSRSLCDAAEFVLLRTR